jgi:hypothetical protein
MPSMLSQPLIALLAAVALGCSAGSAVGGAESTSSPQAKLQVVRKAPLTVRGQGFRARESVRVSASGRNWRLRTSSAGTFVLTLGSGDRCNSVRVLAVGSAGSYAVVKALPSPMCAPARSR